MLDSMEHNKLRAYRCALKGSIILYIRRLNNSIIQMINVHTRIFNTNTHTKKGKREGERLEE